MVTETQPPSEWTRTTIPWGARIGNGNATHTLLEGPEDRKVELLNFGWKEGLYSHTPELRTGVESLINVVPENYSTNLLIEYAPNKIEQNSNSTLARLMNTCLGNILKKDYIESIQPGGGLDLRASIPRFFLEIDHKFDNIICADIASTAGFELIKILSRIFEGLPGWLKISREIAELGPFSNAQTPNISNINRTSNDLEILRRLAIAHYLQKETPPNSLTIVPYDETKSNGIAELMQIDLQKDRVQKARLKHLELLRKTGVVSRGIIKFNCLEDALSPLTSTFQEP